MDVKNAKIQLELGGERRESCEGWMVCLKHAMLLVFCGVQLFNIGFC